MNRHFDFDGLYILDMANNHQGQLEHGRRIVRESGQVVRANQVRAGLKFQFRQLDTFIHPAHGQQSPNKHIGRFLSTRLSKADYAELTAEVRRNELVTICTPFDEESVGVIEELEIEVVKVASSSAADWPLLQRVADSNKPVIFSTGGLNWKQVDDLVSFFEHRRVHFAVMHCVSIYPTPDHQLQLNQIEHLRRRYRNVAVGFSTHERPDDLGPVQVAVAKGARLLERHVGVETDAIKLNAYSSTPAQLDRWIKAAEQARVLCGADERPSAPPEETAALDSLKRGVYARRRLRPGAALERSDVYFAMPYEAGQLSSGEWKAGIEVVQEIAQDGPLQLPALRLPPEPETVVLYTAIHTIKAMLNEAHIALNTDFEAEFSHHYGIANFAGVGATLINCINRTYCKKLIIVMPGQRHPLHFHKKKEESFQMLYGTLELELDGRRRTLHPGDIQLIQQGVWHEFWTETGAIFEEISTTHFNDDSFYEDKAINRLARSERKTLVNHWGRFQI